MNLFYALLIFTFILGAAVFLDIYFEYRENPEEDKNEQP